MRVLALASLIAVCATPAFGSENTKACQLDETRRREPELTAPQPAPTQAEARAAAPRAAEAPPERVEPAPRRRGGRRIPDAELIGPRGVL
jgi:hypothetical protein